MEHTKSRPGTLPFSETEDEGTGANLARNFGHLSPDMVVFHHTKVKYVPVFAQRLPPDTRDQGSQSDAQKCTHASTDTQTESGIDDTGNKDDGIDESLDDEVSREETVRRNLEEHLIYISLCVKPEDLTMCPLCFTDEQKSDILGEKNLIKASRKALEILLNDSTEPGRFAALRDALSANDGYPKIVSILDGLYNPEDSHYVKIVELFTPTIIELLKPTELLPHLLKRGVFNQMDVQEIRAEERNHGEMRAACVLLMYLPRRTVDWFRCFLSALIDCDLDDIATMLDKDIFEEIKLLKSSRCGINLIKSIQSKPRPKPKPKPKIAPKPKYKIAPRNDNANKDNACFRSDKPFMESSETSSHSLGEGNVTEYYQHEVIYSRTNNSNTNVVENTVESNDEEVIYSEFSVEKIDYLTANQNEREKIDKCMADSDAKILWPDKRLGENQILLRSISKSETDERTWSKVRKNWTRNVMETFKKLIAQISLSRDKSRCVGSSVNKILCRKNSHGKQHIVPVKFKPLYGRRVNQNEKLATHENASSSILDSGVRGELNERTNLQSEVLSGACGGDQTSSEKNAHELESDTACIAKIKKCYVCKMTCGRRIWVIKGSIVDLDVDVIVNTTDNHLSLTTGLAETISEKGGETIRTACSRYIQFQRSIDEGEIFVSGAGNLLAKHVIHVNSPVWRGGHEEEDKLLKTSVMNVMLQATKRQAQTLALPAISCGISGFPKKTAADLIVRAVRIFFREEPGSSLRHVYLVDIYQKTAERFHEALCNVFRDDTKCIIEEFND